ncbi:dynein axonemal heavy chain 6-like [Uloborus diversus]|uniref:dynein axonemal heavy chain 6-like n=1 Tax=Uloborus diversus TaxID=327109 RepID=UPI0024094DBA|nr:dynein axonemal heavy chain 6-like [Uloborus diversus]
MEKTEPISVTSLESLIETVQINPDVGYITMSRNCMDLVNNYKPYNYTICHYNNVDKSNYVTISPNGLLEFYKGDVDFMPLDRLLIEHELYNSLKEIPFFKTVRTWKAFMVWFKKIRRRKILDATAKIQAFFSEKLEKKV